MTRHVFIAALLTVICWAAPPSFSDTPAPAATPSITLVLQVTVNPNKPRAEAVKAMQSLGAVIRKQPGLIDEVLLENKNKDPGIHPSHVHVMRWKNSYDWQLMQTTSEFQKTIVANADYFTIDAVSIFGPIQ